MSNYNNCNIPHNQEYFNNYQHIMDPNAGGSYAFMDQRQMLREQQQQQQYPCYPTNTNTMHRPYAFNVNASEFVPSRNHQHMNALPAQFMYESYVPPHPQQYHHLQQYYQQFPAHHHAPQPYHPQQIMYQDEQSGIEALAQYGQQSEYYSPSMEMQERIARCPNPAIIHEILVGCEQLLLEGEDDSNTWTTAIRQRFDDSKMDIESKKVATGLIIEIAYSTSTNQTVDPQYTFATLLQTLSKDMEYTKTALLPCLEENHRQRRNLTNDEKIRLVIFFAEVYLKVTLENGSRIEKFASAVCDQLDDIVRLPPCDEFMKGLMRVLKVAGAELDENHRERIDELLTKMGGFANGSQKISQVVKAQIESLIKCRERGWDRIPQPRIPFPSYNALNEDDLDEYGLELTEDENKFIESQIDALTTTNEGDDDNEQIDENDVMKEFGKFVDEELNRSTEAENVEIFAKLQISDAAESEAKKEIPSADVSETNEKSQCSENQ
ncbi:unnamed protein product [Caenorhabditis bovis]|uniref:MIF4G domain-containing protein n=1 Tax=Caenorhabditis bovis TaxID=2654633 RepID=A0A8S1EVE6_9PELO|nr:unnamed protein product [Caenorhabditis bovis]